MLEFITLQTINKIFENLNVNISEMTKIVYINCLIHHFKNKRATYNNAKAFDIVNSDFDFSKFKKNFQELHKAGAININGSIITFNNLWGKYIDTGKLIKEDKPNITIIKADKVKDSLLSSHQLQEVCQMKYKLTKDRITQLIEIFVKEQSVIDKTYSSQGDCTKHFIYWLKYNKDKSDEQENNTNKTASVKSKGRLLGK